MSECKVDHNLVSAEREVEILKDVIRALLPNRHALGRVAGELGQKPDGSLAFWTTVTVPLDRSNDESATRELTAALVPELRAISDAYETAVMRVFEEMRAEGDAITSVLTKLRDELSIAEDDERACGDRRDWHATNAAENRTSALRFAIELIEREAAKTKGGGR